jgi:hypothetical protein
MAQRGQPAWVLVLLGGAAIMGAAALSVAGFLVWKLGVPPPGAGNQPPAAQEKRIGEPRGDTPADVARKYIAARTAAERLPLVYDRPRIEPIALPIWEQHRIKHTEPIEPSRVQMVGDGAARVTTLVRQGEATGDLSHYVRKTPDGWRVDWMASYGYNPYSLQAVKGAVKTGKHTMRVLVRIGDIYMGNWRGTEADAFAFTIEDSQAERGEPSAFVSGYTWRTDPHGQALFALCQDGKKHHAILELEYDFPTPEVIAIRRVVATSWLEP